MQKLCVDLTNNLVMRKIRYQPTGNANSISMKFLSNKKSITTKVAA